LAVGLPEFSDYGYREPSAYSYAPTENI